MDKIILKGISVGGDSLIENQPENPNFFSLYITLSVGHENMGGSSLYELHVCSIEWLDYAIKYTENRTFWGRNSLIIERFDEDVIVKVVNEKLNEISEYCGKNKNSPEETFSRYAYWEFEDFNE